MRTLTISSVATVLAALLFSFAPIDSWSAGKNNKKKNNNNSNRSSAVRSSSSGNPRMQISTQNRSPITNSSINRSSSNNRNASNNRSNNNNKARSNSNNRSSASSSNRNNNANKKPNNSNNNQKKPKPVYNKKPSNSVVRSTTTSIKRPENPRLQAGRVPTTKPGSVNYPRVVTATGNRNSHNHNHNKPNNNRNQAKPGNHQNHNHRRHQPNRVSSVVRNSSVVNRWDNRWQYSNNVWGNHAGHNHNHGSSHYRPHSISSNFQHAVNYAYRPTAWGSRPWWDSGSCHDWHRGSWNYGWNNRWQSRYHRSYRPSYSYLPGYYTSSNSGLGSSLAWGLAGWTLGKLVYDTGYSTYTNPYSAPRIQSYNGGYSYSEPLTVYAAETPPESEEIAISNEEQSAAALDESREAFKRGDYLTALNRVDEAISFETGDPALHEYRALVLFALGRYGDAAGVLNPVLASGPGWDWATMIGLYPNSDVYTDQLRKLESYVSGSPESADAHFVLGYHYMVGGFLEEAFQMFDRVTQLQPADSVARQLRNLAANSLPSEEEEVTESVEGSEPDRVILTEEVLYGSWKALSGEGKAITLALASDGQFSWKYEGAAEGEVLSGNWNIDDDGYLVLADEDVQLVGDVSLEGDHTMRFVLVGGPEGDPGLVFERL